jgi:RNA polymerase sigma-70 factor (ECF subfamily)
LSRQLGAQDAEDALQETLLVVVRAIRNGSIREPEKLAGFVQIVAKRQAFGVIGQRVHSRQKEAELDTGRHVSEAKQDPERDAMVRERAELMKRALGLLSPRDREILIRFYLREQTAEEVCRDMNLTETQFRLMKSRAKAKFGELGKQELQSGSRSALRLRPLAATR